MRLKTIDLEDPPTKRGPEPKPRAKAKPKERVGHGIFTWAGMERRTDRYGSFVLGDQPSPGKRLTAPFLDLKALKRLEGKRVHVVCKVVVARKSEHIGDMFHGFAPSTPKVDEEVDLGVGVLHLEDAGFDGLTAVVLEPHPTRQHFWMDPRKLYRLHSQTVDLFITKTAKPCSPKANFKKELTFETEPVSMDIGDGTMQHKSKIPDGVELHIAGDVERLGGGLMIVTPPGGEKGKRRKITRR